MLYLNKTQIKGHDLKVAATLPLAGEDVSGQSSLDAVAEGGDKSKQINVKLQIKYIDAATLSELVNLAEDKTDKGERIVYDIVNNTANAMNIRKVKFNGEVSVREDESLHLWRVGFKLTEIKSVSETKEARQTPQDVVDQKPMGVTTEPADTAIPKAEDLTSVERFLKFVDDAISGGDS